MDVGTMQGYIAWAQAVQIRPVVLGSHSAEAIATALAALDAAAQRTGQLVPVVIAAHSEGGSGGVRAVVRAHDPWLSADDAGMDAGGRAADVGRGGIHIVGIALLDSVHSAKDLPGAGDAVAAPGVLENDTDADGERTELTRCRTRGGWRPRGRSCRASPC